MNGKKRNVHSNKISLYLSRGENCVENVIPPVNGACLCISNMVSDNSSKDLDLENCFETRKLVL